MPNLAKPEGEKLIDSFILPSAELIIVDNLSCLLRGEGRENEAEVGSVVVNGPSLNEPRGKA